MLCIIFQLNSKNKLQMFPLCCCCCRLELQLTCIYIGLIEIVLAVTRLATFIRPDENIIVWRDCPNCQNMTSTLGLFPLPSYLLPRTFLFCLQLLTGVLLVVGAGRQIRHFILVYLVTSVVTTSLSLCFIIFLLVEPTQKKVPIWVLYTRWLILYGPTPYFWLVAIFYILEMLEIERAVGY
ncbi:uncharacterized protein LOC115634202 [Scaptodrosophila lebanonensis]|uniref:Uncharacterized protein LOC115634202 n=1 Tax=Drosophila lebanonensis TaxID=7225 RepID=A0A6J2UGV8_DROLE|nr:uncharacterized protein LOC115634202 [Scaptodrosophila lebanonensis]